MLTNIRRALLVSAAARDLAVGLVREHGAVALDIVDQALAIADRERPDDAAASQNERILTASRAHIVSLVGLLPDRGGHHAERADIEEMADILSKRSR